MDAAEIVHEFKGLHTDITAILEKAGAKDTELDARLHELEQKMARRGSFGPARNQSWGEQFAEAQEVKAFAGEHSRPGRVRLEMKTTITSASDSGGGIVVPQRDQVVMMPKRRLTVRNLLPAVGVSASGSVEYPKQTVRTNNADVVAEGALKAESAYAWEMDTAPIRTIAHWVPASRQILDDAPQLAGIIDTELRYGLAIKEEVQLLNGSGSGQNLSGLVTNATAYSAPVTIDSPNSIDLIGLAMLQSALAEFPPDGVVMNPTDWMFMRLLKNADGNYILGDPSKEVEPRLFGVPVVLTTAMTVDKFLVGNFQVAATLYDRWLPRVEVSTEHADFFVRNLVAILAEERIGLAVKQAGALIYGDFGRV